MINKNATYVVKQPEHLVMSLVTLNKNFPKSQKFQDLVDELNKISDTFFIFDGVGNVDQNKFTTLHGGSGFIVRSGKTVGETLFYLMDYSREIFGRHITFCSVNENLIENIETVKGLGESIINWTALSTSKPIIQIERQKPLELWELYKTSTWKKHNGGNYITHNSMSPIIYMKEQTVIKLMSKPKLVEYLKTFTDNNPNTVIASIIMDMGIGHINLLG